MLSIAKIIFGALLQVLLGRAESWYKQELRYREHRKILMEGVENVSRKLAEENDAIALTPESVDDSFMRLERIARRSSDSD